VAETAVKDCIVFSHRGLRDEDEYRRTGRHEIQVFS